MLPVVLNDSRGPLVVTDSSLMFVSSATGNHLVDRLSDVHSTHFSHVGSGFSRRKRFHLAIEVGDHEVLFGVTGYAKNLIWLARRYRSRARTSGKSGHHRVPTALDLTRTSKAGRADPVTVARATGPIRIQSSGSTAEMNHL